MAERVKIIVLQLELKNQGVMQQIKILFEFIKFLFLLDKIITQKKKKLNKINKNNVI